jgi:hypothetical protein
MQLDFAKNLKIKSHVEMKALVREWKSLGEQNEARTFRFMQWNVLVDQFCNDSPKARRPTLTAHAHSVDVTNNERDSPLWGPKHETSTSDAL